MIKMLVPMVLCLIFSTLQVKGQDIDTCFTKEEVIILDGKINNMKRTIELQDSLLKVYESQIQRYEILIANDTVKYNLMYQKVAILEETNELLRKRAQLTEPKWYENNYLYFIAGMLTTTLVFGAL